MSSIGEMLTGSPEARTTRHQGMASSRSPSLAKAFPHRLLGTRTTCKKGDV